MERKNGRNWIGDPGYVNLIGSREIQRNSRVGNTGISTINRGRFYQKKLVAVGSGSRRISLCVGSYLKGLIKI